MDEQTAAPETAAPETAAPETAAPETAAPETAAPETAAAAAPAKPPKDVQNGVTKPAGEKTGRVWAIADEISRLKKRPATRKEVVVAGVAEGLSNGTLATQFGHWQKYHGVVTAKPAKTAEPAAAAEPASSEQPAPDSNESAAAEPASSEQPAPDSNESAAG